MKLSQPTASDISAGIDLVGRLRRMGTPVTLSRWVKRSGCYWTLYIQSPQTSVLGPLQLYRRILSVPEGRRMADDVTLVRWDDDEPFHQKQRKKR